MWSKSVIGAVGLAASLGIGGVAYAATNGSSSHAATGTAALSSQTAGSTSTAAGGRAKRAKGLLARADHGTIELKVKGQWVTYELDRGKVSAVSPTSITLARPDGQSVTEAINSNTKFKGVPSEAGIQTGRSALVLSENGTAVRIRQVTGAAASTSAGSVA